MKIVDRIREDTIGYSGWPLAYITGKNGKILRCHVGLTVENLLDLLRVLNSHLQPSIKLEVPEEKLAALWEGFNKVRRDCEQVMQETELHISDLDKQTMTRMYELGCTKTEIMTTYSNTYPTLSWDVLREIVG